MLFFEHYEGFLVFQEMQLQQQTCALHKKVGLTAERSAICHIYVASFDVTEATNNSETSFNPSTSCSK